MVAGTMKAAVLHDTRDMRCENIPKPKPRPGEALVRVAYCGVCGSDVPRYLDGAVHGFPLVLGHEFSGAVEQVGSEANANLLGKRVACVPLKPCMECPDCLAGNYALCGSYGFIGSRQPGAFAEFVALPVENLYLLLSEVTDLEGAFFEPASVAQHAIDLVHPLPKSNAAVLGCGTIGIFVTQLLQAAGLQVTAFARRKIRLDAARAAGIENLIDTSSERWIEDSLDSLPRRGFDYIFDTSGNNVMMAQTFGLAATKGTVCYVGTPKRPMEFSVREWEHINRKELTVTGSWMSYGSPFPGREWHEVSNAFSTGLLRVVPEMLDSICPLEDLPEAMEKFAKPNRVNGKLLVRP